MKKILITGKDSYIGNSLENWLMKEPDTYKVDIVDMKDELWREKDFSQYDVVFHVAGIAHVSSDSKLKDSYYKVNTELTVQTAKKAKKDGVKQFIFMSSIIVYGNDNGIITKNIDPNPKDFYGDSKLRAEEEIKGLIDSEFKIVIIRPPMIYGKGSKGNYPRLAKLAKKAPIFPDIDNQRSMLHIDNLCEFLRLIIQNEEAGLFFPQNQEYVKTSEMVKLIGEVNGRKIRLIKLFNPIIKIFINKVNVLNKVFGNLVYDKSMSENIKFNYCIRQFKDSIKLTEGDEQ